MGKINPRFCLGCIFAKFLDTGKVQKIRIIGIQNETTVRVMDMESKETVHMNYDKLIKEYTLINPNGYIYLNIVGMNENKKDIEESSDVVVCFFTQKTITTPPYIPDVICRQNINNIFDVIKRVRKYGNTPNIVGCCVTPETCPADMDYNILLASDSVKYSTCVAMYNSDSLDDILGCFNTNKYDTELFNIHSRYENYIKELYSDVHGLVPNDKRFFGYCDTLKDLLKDNDFMYDVRRALGITEIKSKITFIQGDDDELILSAESKTALEEEFGHYLINPVCTRCVRESDISGSNAVDKNIMQSIIIDSDNILYLLSYIKGANLYCV